MPHGLARLPDIPTNSSGKLERKAECGMPVRNPRSPDVCPLTCPFLQYVADRPCEFACVDAEGCDQHDPLSTYADPTTRICGACQVPGCKHCGAGPKECILCSNGFEYVEGQCLSTHRHYWWGVYGFLSLLLLVILYYVVQLWARPVVNKEVVEKALEFRESSKPRNPTDGGLYPILTTNLRTTFISGAGVQLHFTWQMALICWAAFMMVVLGGASLMGRYYGYSRPPHPLSIEAHEACLSGTAAQWELSAIASTHRTFEFYYMLALCVAYLASFVCSLWFAVHQRRLFDRIDERNATMEDYAMFVEGLPSDGGERLLEEEVLEFFRRALPARKLVGVSICWDYTGKTDQIDALVEREIEAAEHLGALEHGLDSSSESHRCDVHFRCLDKPILNAFLGRCGGGEEVEWPGSFAQGADVASTLRGLESSGAAVVVFASEAELEAGLASAGEQGLKFRGEFPLTFTRHHCDAETMLWQGFGKGYDNFHRRVLLGTGLLCLVIVGWAALFYAPYAWYVLSYSHVVAGDSVTWNLMVQGILLGLVISLGNQVVYQASSSIAEWAGFKYADRRDRFYVCLYTFAVLINTILDLWTTVVLAYGYSTQDPAATAEKHEILSPGALVRRVDVQHALYVQLFAYLWPATLLIPFLVEPIMTWCLPYYLMLWLVRSRRDVGIRDAEQLLVCWDFDLSRYGDNLINAVLCLLMVFFCSLDVWQTFGYFVLTLLFVLGWDHVRFLRASKRSFFATEAMDITAQWLGMVPCAILAAALAFRVFGSLHPDDPLTSRGTLTFSMVWVVVGGAFVLHLCMHSFCLRLVVPRFVPKDEDAETVSYAAAASEIACNWFTANPVHCLRSKYIYQHERPCVPYRAGKEYLQRRNEELGLYYEAKRRPAPEEPKTPGGAATSSAPSRAG